MMGGMKRPPAGSERSGRGPYVTASFYALGSVLVLFGELFSAEAESAYDSQADRDVADGAAAQDDDVEVCHRAHPSTVTSMFSTKITRSCR